MNTSRNCGCKGIRTCLLCETMYQLEEGVKGTEPKKLDAWSYCPKCNKLYEGWDVWAVLKQHHSHSNLNSLYFPGILVKNHFLTDTECDTVIKNIDSMPWSLSQSGRRKQNFGPKVNFKKQKLKNGSFEGFPFFTKFVHNKLNDIDLLHDFQAIEQCSLEYDPSRGAAIDAHIDDCWIWGERVVTVNCLGDTVLTLTVYNDVSEKRKYNLNILSEYADQLLIPLMDERNLRNFSKCVIRIPMPKLSMVALYGPARYQMEHSILREDVVNRRICLAFREFTPAYKHGRMKELGNIVTHKAKQFWNI